MTFGDECVRVLDAYSVIAYSQQVSKSANFCHVVATVCHTVIYAYISEIHVFMHACARLIVCSVRLFTIY